jgi:hypothetical protein
LANVRAAAGAVLMRGGAMKWPVLQMASQPMNVAGRPRIGVF